MTSHSWLTSHNGRPRALKESRTSPFDSRRHSEIWMLSEECVGVEVNTNFRNSASLPNEFRVSLD